MTITIKLSESLAYQDKVQNVEEMKGGPFVDVYIKAAKNVIDIVKSAEKYIKDVEDDKCTSGSCMNYYSNNIVAFIGDRGTGKSSAMKSFVNALTRGELWGIEGKLECALEQNMCVLALPVIDPSHLKSDEGILESVIANMYAEVKQIIENKSKNKWGSKKEVPVDQMQDILSQFDKTYISLKCYRSEGKRGYDNENDTALEKLDRLSSSQNLRSDVQELVEKYLEMCAEYSDCLKRNKNRESKFIIITIDDLDMNIEYGFELAEEIRKFLMLPNIIIVMALNIDQFSQLVQREYLVKYEIMIKHSYLNEHIYQLAEKYITKFLPFNRRCAMPDLTAVSTSSLHVEFENQPTEPLTEYFLKKIYTTTGILLLKNNAGGHGIIPDNLREIHQLYALLKNMEPVDIYECIIGEEKVKMKENLKLNLEVFGHFLSDSYFKKYMPMDYLKILDEFNRIDSSHLNKFVIKKINELMMKEKDIIDSDEKSNNPRPKESVIDDIETTETLKTVPEDYCIGDVLKSLNEINNRYNDSTMQKFIEGMKILYSIRILKLIFIAENWKETRIIIGELMHAGQYSQFNYDPGDVEVILKGLTKNYYLQFFISHYNQPSKSKKEAQFEPTYIHRFNLGSSKNFTIDLSSFVANLLDLKLIDDRVNNGQFDLEKMEKIENWRKEYVAALPVWSLDFIDNFFKKVPREYELNSKGAGGADPRQKAAYVFYAFADICIKIIRENEFIRQIKCRGDKMLAEVFQTTLESLIGEDNFDGEFVTYLANIGSVPFKEEIVWNFQPMTKDGISLRRRTLRAIKIFDKLYYITKGYELLLKTLVALIGRDRSKYEALKNMDKRIKMIESDNSEKQKQRLKLPHDIFPEFIYITTTRTNDQNLELCKSAFTVLGYDYNDNFEVYCEPEPSSTEPEDDTK